MAIVVHQVNIAVNLLDILLLAFWMRLAKVLEYIERVRSRETHGVRVWEGANQFMLASTIFICTYRRLVIIG